MVSADNLNYDVLELIFAWLSGHDLAAVSQVSRSFLAGAIPRLYKTINFSLKQAKTYPRTMSPFAVVLAHPHLAIHVRRIDIRAVPSLHSQLKTQAHPEFLRDCLAAVAASKNLISFTCTPFHILPSFITPLQNKERLQTLRINASLATDQAEKLLHLTGLKSLTLEHASWIVVDSLPKWARSLQSTLTQLTLYMVADFNSCILDSTLPHLPKLRGLHIIGCPGVDHVDILRATVHTPLLESLAISTSEYRQYSQLPNSLVPLQHLRHLAIDSESHSHLATTTIPALWSSIFESLHLWAAPLTSVALRPTTRLSCDGLIKELIDMHGSTLKFLSLLNCTVSIESMADIAEKCTTLERLALPIADVRDVTGFRLALRKSPSIHTLVDVGDAHTTHGPRVSLTTEPVRHMMEEIPSLHKVVSENRHWTGQTGSDGVRVTLDRKKPGTSSHWFMPP
ncbi:hypothetical protein EW146_g8741 [Bondarzewia mesenterica]|uniref:F-box domain-containing protein n=1 Tax=Bondarzewia mesenterica TaxID=1095465 RepID=A0A4V3XDC9_9AGAM|nr:hypothetical protein EW146_g8741 [Bondarzewia mesenterica]